MLKKITACALAMAACTAHAEGFYVGASYGQSHFRDDSSRSDVEAYMADEFSSDASVSSFKNDNRDNGYKLFAGYKFNENFAMEASYVDLGEIKASMGYTAYSADGYVTATGEASAVALSFVGMLPVGQGFTLFAKAGPMQSRFEVNIKDDYAGDVYTQNTRAIDLAAAMGVGVSYNLLDNVDIRFEVERFAKMGNSDTGEIDVDLFSLGASYSF